MECLLEVLLNESDTVRVDYWHNIEYILHKQVLILLIISNKCLMDELKRRVKCHLDRDQLASVVGAGEEDRRLPFLILNLLLVMHLFLTPILELLLQLKQASVSGLVLGSTAISSQVFIIQLELLGEVPPRSNVLGDEVLSINLNHVNITLLPTLADALHRHELWVVSSHRFDEVSCFSKENMIIIVPRQQLPEDLLTKRAGRLEYALDVDLAEGGGIRTIGRLFDH